MKRCRTSRKLNLLKGVVPCRLPYGTVTMARRTPCWLVGWFTMLRARLVWERAIIRQSGWQFRHNEPQPDALLLIDPTCGGRRCLSTDDYIEGPPELVAEVASSSVSYDLHAKLHVYRRNGVREYVVWRVLEQAIDWFVLRAGQYERLPVDANGLLRSEVFPGLWLDPAALVRGDLATVLAMVQQGLGSPEHAAFVARLHPPATTP